MFKTLKGCNDSVAVVLKYLSETRCRNCKLRRSLQAPFHLTILRTLRQTQDKWAKKNDTGQSTPMAEAFRMIEEKRKNKS